MINRRAFFNAAAVLPPIVLGAAKQTNRDPHTVKLRAGNYADLELSVDVTSHFQPLRDMNADERIEFRRWCVTNNSFHPDIVDWLIDAPCQTSRATAERLVRQWISERFGDAEQRLAQQIQAELQKRQWTADDLASKMMREQPQYTTERIESLLSGQQPATLCDWYNIAETLRVDMSALL